MVLENIVSFKIFALSEWIKILLNKLSVLGRCVLIQKQISVKQMVS